MSRLYLGNGSAPFPGYSLRQVLTATTKKVVNFLRKKVYPWPPMYKILATRLHASYVVDLSLQMIARN